MNVEILVTDEYDRKLDEFASEHGGVSREAAEEAFREHCETFQETLKDDAPIEEIRSLAFDKLEWDPPDGDAAEG